MQTRRTFQDDLAHVHDAIIAMGARAQEAVQQGSAALLDEDPSLIELVEQTAQELDELADQVEERVCLLLATQQPTAGDLRLLIGALWMIRELERVGGNMTHVARASNSLAMRNLRPDVRGVLSGMRDQAIIELRVAVAAFTDHDVDKVAEVKALDDAMDALQRTLLGHAVGDEGLAGETRVQLALLGRYYERVADLAVNMADRVRYLVTGELHHFAPIEDVS